VNSVELSRKWQALAEKLCDPPAVPEWVNGVPLCSEGCPHHGKRCGAIGYRMGRICEPSVIAMAITLDRCMFHLSAETLAGRAQS
jgi:hypothetical protein